VTVLAAARRLVRRYRSGAGPPQPASADAAPPREALVRTLERGTPLDRAVLAQIRALVADGDADSARAIAEALRRHERTCELGHLATGLIAFREGYPRLAWAELNRVPQELWATEAPAAYVRSGLAVAPDDALRAVRGLLTADPSSVSARNWFDIFMPLFGYGASQIARETFARFEQRLDRGSPGWRDAAEQRAWMREWVDRDPESPTAAATGRRTFAIMDYGHPGANRASANLGDHVQSIAALGHLVRHRNVRLHGSEELIALLDELSSRTRTERRLDGPQNDLDIMTVHRDASMYEPIPEDTWVLCFGWYMHALFSMRHGFPLHRNLRPIFISFHCNKRNLLTPDAIEYLKRYGPVGCRDWTTVYLLQSAGVPAFFSGCLTTTIDTVFPDLSEPAPSGAPIAYVDAPAERMDPDGVVYHHSSRAVRRRSFVQNTRKALDLLDTYRSQHSRVVTSRLHCYLPMRSIGQKVDFVPRNPSDVRFDGLAGIDERAFDAMREALLAKLETVMDAVLSGRSERDVYELWRSITAADVTAAEERRLAPSRLRLADSSQPVRQSRSAIVSAGSEADDAIDVAVVLRKSGGLRNVTALTASLLEHASRPLHLWLLAHSGTRGALARLAEAFPSMRVSWVPIGDLPEGRPEVVARLLLADLLEDVARLVLLPLPSVATGDIAELAALDLGAHAVAAPTRPGPGEPSGFGVINAAALRLDTRTRKAAELRRTAHACHHFDFDAFTLNVMVMNLARLREERFGARALALMCEFGLDDVEAMHYIVGPNRAVVPERWAVVPTRTPERGAGLLHWADGVKPWQPRLVPERDSWRRYASALET
jgi:hypothetical protein